jgi:hypothetical protein
VAISESLKNKVCRLKKIKTNTRNIKTSEESHAHQPSQVPIWKDQNIPKNNVKKSNFNKKYQFIVNLKSYSHTCILEEFVTENKKITLIKRPINISMIAEFRIKGCTLFIEFARSWFVEITEFSWIRSSVATGIINNKQTQKGIIRLKRSNIIKVYKNLINKGLLPANPKYPVSVKVIKFKFSWTVETTRKFTK